MHFMRLKPRGSFPPNALEGERPEFRLWMIKTTAVVLAMRASDALIVWTPNCQNHAKNPTRGKIKLFDHQLQDDPAYTSSVGACDTNWKDTDDAGRLVLMQQYVNVMLHEDNLELHDVKAAVSQIDEFADFPFSTELLTNRDVG